MRADIHPDYHEVLFHDTNADVYFLTRSTIRSKKNLLYAIPTAEIAENKLIGANNYGY